MVGKVVVLGERGILVVGKVVVLSQKCGRKPKYPLVTLSKGPITRSDVSVKFGRPIRISSRGNSNFSDTRVKFGHPTRQVAGAKFGAQIQNPKSLNFRGLKFGRDAQIRHSHPSV